MSRRQKMFIPRFLENLISIDKILQYIFFFPQKKSFNVHLYNNFDHFLSIRQWKQRYTIDMREVIRLTLDKPNGFIKFRVIVTWKNRFISATISQYYLIEGGQNWCRTKWSYEKSFNENQELRLILEIASIWLQFARYLTLRKLFFDIY